MPANSGIPKGMQGLLLGCFLVFGLPWLFYQYYEWDEQRKAEKAAATEVERRRPENIRLNRVAEIVNALKANLREPESAAWERILANTDASVVCIQYRARNGFGGMGQEVMVVAKGKASQEISAWNKHCAGKSLHDMSNVKYVLDR